MNVTSTKEIIRRIPSLRAAARGLWRLSRELPRRIPIQKIPSLQRWSGRPSGYHQSATDYLAVNPSKGWEKVIYPAGSYERVKPSPVGQALPRLFDPPQTVRWDDERVLFLENCRYWGGYGGSIIGMDNKIIGDLSPDVWGLENHSLLNRFKLPKPIHLSGLTAVISTPEASTNYSHWMMELIPRVHLLNSAGYGPRDIDRYLVNLGGCPYELETMRLLGIPHEKILPATGKSHFICERIVTTSLRKHHWQHSLPKWVPGFLREMAGCEQKQTVSNQRFYLTRRRASFRRVLNENAFHGLLAANGFEVVDPASLSVKEQAALFAGAALIVSPHSSAMTNLIFCNPGTVVLEIFPADYFDVSFWTAASITGCVYNAFVAARPPGAEPASQIEARRQDIVLDEARLACVASFLQTHDHTTHTPAGAAASHS